MGILAAGVVVDGAIRYKLEWVDDLSWGYLVGQRSYIDKTIFVHMFQHQNVMALIILLSIYLIKKLMYTQTRVEPFEPELGQRTISLQKYEIENKYFTLNQKA